MEGKLMEQLVQRFDELARVFGSVSSLVDLAQAVGSVVESVVEVQYAGYYFRDPDTEGWKLVWTKGFTDAEARAAEETAEQRHPGWVFRTGKILHVPDVEADPEHSTTDSVRSFKVQSRLYIPVIARGRVVGALGLGNSNKHAFTAAHISTLSYASGLAGLAYDRILSTKQVRAGETLHRCLVENLHEIILVVDRDGRVKHESPSARRGVGARLTESVTPDLLSIVHPDDAGAVGRVLRSLGAGEPVPESFELRLEGTVGEWRIMEATFSALPDDMSSAGIVVTMRDVTDRHLAQERLHTSERKFRLIAESAMDAIVMVTDDGTITYWNAAAESIFGYERAEAVGRDADFLLSRTRYGQAYQAHLNVFAMSGRAPGLARVS